MNRGKNILLITSIYPTLDPAYKASPICHYFAKQWKEMGFNIRVAHMCYALPTIYSWIAKLFGNYAMKKMWSVSFLKPDRKIAKYDIEGIPVTYIPVIHPIPHIGISHRRRVKAYKYLHETLESEHFVPDLVISHWHSMAYFMPFVKCDYPQVRTSVVVHNMLKYDKDFHSVFNAVDTWGFRSKSLKENFEHVYGKQEREFICLSGVPSSYVPLTYPNKDFSEGVNHFVFVGSLVKLKNVDIAISALHDSFKGEDFLFDVVGDGPEMPSLKKLTEKLGESRHVVFHGHLAREKAQEIVSHAQVFIMVSTTEAFGLVYVEAMAKGCIPIATVGQGADGFVENAKNGFLCKAKDVSALSTIISKVRCTRKDEVITMSQNAYATAREMTDEIVAKKYLSYISY